MKFDITFLVITYNQEEYILECLESIKHQRVKHLPDKSVQLAVTDDCSPDRTFELVGTWIARNGRFFDECIVNRNETNLGISKNLREGFKLVNGNLLKMIAGDDLLPRQSVAVFFDLLKEYEFVMGLPIYFSGDNEKIFYLNKTIGHIAHEYVGGGKQYLQRLNRDCFIHSPSVFFHSKLVLNRSVNDFMKEFSFLEDYPMWYGIGENFPNIRYKFIQNIAILYRRTNNSAFIVRSFEIYNDRIKLAKYILEKKGINIYDAFVKLNEIIVLKLAKRFNKYTLLKYLVFDNYIQKIEHVVFKSIAPIDSVDISRLIDRQKIYLRAISRIAKNYRLDNQKQAL